MINEKTNVNRLLDAKKIKYEILSFATLGAVSGVDAANYLGLEYKSTFKTLVTEGKSGKHYVFDIPVDKELDLKKGAAAVGEKNISMLKSKDLLPLTGYIHGGCSPIGMKKFFTTTFDSSIRDLKQIVFSAGKVGYFVKLNVCDIEKIIKYSVADLTEN